LRTWDKADREPMALIDQDEQVCQFLPAIGTRETTNEIIERSTRHYDAKGFFLYAVELKETGEMIGFVRINNPFV
jgi:RimJ/RimL family protein N-acetyltransferase